jgi:lipopolysaccharide/colanic/teichoic acid biosynthesis glycosyltransferase
VAVQDDESIVRADSGVALRDVLSAFRPDHIAKRLADLATAAMGLVLFSPLFLITCLAIKLDSPGPVLVRETRYGCRNRPIQVFQFRLAEARAEGDRSSPRPTRVGKILGQTGIDELPRLVNVLRGEMSIFGPPPSTDPKASPRRAKPGIIRWAQIIATRDADPD